MAAHGSGRFLAYHEPDIIAILTLLSFFIFLAISEWLADATIRAGLIGQIIVGIIYGVPLANIMALEWQETFLALGYIGLILIIFEGGLTIRLDLLRQNFVLSVIAALLGVLTPIALSFALLHAAFGHSALEAFIVGTSLCSTSLGTTFAVLSTASRGIDFSQTRIGTVLVSAAIIDDVAALVLVSVIHQLRDLANGSGELGWIIGQPILASGLLGVVTPIVAKFILGPGFRKFLEKRMLRFKHIGNLALMVLVLSAFLVIAAYAGASVLFGAFLAGTVLSSLVTKQPGDVYGGESSEENETAEGKMPTFLQTLKKYVGGPQKYIFQPLFFASIGFAIPFLDMWTGEMIWKGLVFTILMVLGKLVVGTVVPVWDLLSGNTTKEKAPSHPRPALNWAPATLLGTAMVARGEIGLLIIQIGLNETPYLTQKAFIIGVWAIVLNTIVGPVSVGILLKSFGQKIADDRRWGTQSKTKSPEVERIMVGSPTASPSNGNGV
ncbi:sodium-hydrogen antiporter [Echria macrotheca]|uniref:Sodium-hydrogen antiporter n=1 Tax=Echria macrotheca TaxID=438768 RepID=A0AAJ0BN54_9PEZI|nr:sodium-hydrogen antiporter [Echria macrotheca]